MNIDELIASRPNGRRGKDAWCRSLLEEAKGQGFSVADLANRLGMSVATIYMWKRRMRSGLSVGGDAERQGGTEGQGLVRIEVRESNAPRTQATSRFEVRLANGRCLFIPERYDQSQLVTLVQVLERC